jgi:hypothetical protein
MPNYIITANREVFYCYNIKANTEKEAIEKMYEIDSENYAEYAYDWVPLQVTEITKDEEGAK